MVDEHEHRGIALVLLGMVAVVAVVGFVLMFAQGESSAGLGVYGGPAQRLAEGLPMNNPTPYYNSAVPQARDTPEGFSWDEYLAQGGSWDSITQSPTHWNYDGTPKGSLGDIPSYVALNCGPNGVYYSSNRIGEAELERSRGNTVVQNDDGTFCVYAPSARVGGIAGRQ
ncbi:hypothetical protein COV18_07045 [Candidatus Woesearchaeota archaeon CG10_big_fil_rev_8_21_14_0_10_37_12]|nr:MAG: hypothetical protein COV18_07045 [Candidatus Woesearchaeota archaeon CG10_big_fil_rev_8_21_14_0_10_37_12]